ncbi:CHAT domain-containing protein [Sulfidibacter corallicola]|uniref:CHAT domain-containing protein n=1 Tax=Sulfidibacter corallicola TaxID=2818388 RepID=A0A8A4TJE9_SULCO|nr:CHAT domain-containing protein [Sulfidibacter corallicola]QTD49617.1 CHAT domain-containing protein [Sulfidibacter corallicola]
MALFEIKIVPSEKESVILAESNFGEATIQVPNVFLEEMINKSEQLRESHKKPDLCNLKEEMINFGIRLFSGIIKGDILTLFNRTIGGSLEGQLDIRLMLGKAKLNAIQWELMHYRKEYIGFRHNFVRHPFVARPANIPQRERKKLRVLAVCVDPLFGESGIHEEHQNLCEILQGYGDSINFTSLYQEEATLDNIKDCLFEGVDIWHFTGHGHFNSKDIIESYLLTWGRSSRDTGLLSIRTLATLAVSQSIGFCYLNACNTARESISKNKITLNETQGDSLVNMAHGLIEAGAPLVVATNHEITIWAATVFSRRFYKSIIKYGNRVDQAVRQGRAELYIDSERGYAGDWSSPVLYGRSQYMGLGLEALEWRESFDLFRVRNVEKPVLHETAPEEDQIIL